MPPFPGFCGEGYLSQSSRASCARSVNLYPQRIDTVGAKAGVVLYPTPGLRTYATPPAGTAAPGRAMFAEAGRAFTVHGTRLAEIISGSGTDVTLGTLVDRGAVRFDGLTPASLATNGDPGHQLCIASGRRIYILDLLSNVLTQPTDATLDQICMLDGRFVGLDAQSSTLRVSNIFNGAIWDTLQSTVRTTASDPWKAMALTSSKELFILGEQTGDIYYNSGASPFPFVPRQGVLVRPGIIAPWSLKECNGSMIWLSNHGDVVRAQGYNATAISSEALANAISRYKRESQIADAVGFAYRDQDHWFYDLNFPSAGATWTWDEDTGWWHERGTWDGETGDYIAWAPQYYCNAFGRHLVSSFRTGTIHEMAITEYQDADSAPLRRLRVAPGLFADGHDIFVDRFALYLDTGQGLTLGQGSDPQVMLRASRTGSQTWDAERWRSAGAKGEVKTATLEWNKFGRADDWAFQVAFSDPIPWRIVNAFLDVRVVK